MPSAPANTYVAAALTKTGGGPGDAGPLGLQIQQFSGLDFPWADYHPHGVLSSSDGQLGADGVTFAMNMLLRWDDLDLALSRLLGYSYRDTTQGTPGVLRRKLPWQHPQFNQLWVKNIASVKGIRLEGKSSVSVLIAGGGTGDSGDANLGPYSEFHLCQLTLNFWRPPYAVRSDRDITFPVLDPQTGNPTGNTLAHEWLRYTDRNWTIATQMLTREGSQFVWSPNQGLQMTPFQGSVGQKVTKLKLSRRWYQIPEACLFSSQDDFTTSGFPTNLLLTQTGGTNPITGYRLPVGSPITGCVNLPIGGGKLTNAPPYVSDSIQANRFFGFPMGTLLYEGAEIIPQPLQLPPYLMRIPTAGVNEALSQVQYDVIFHFEYFNPQKDQNVPMDFNGYNLAPFSGNGLWYAVQSQLGTDGANTAAYPSNPAQTPLHYADLSTLYKVL
jgi:hypothetical protein